MIAIPDSVTDADWQCEWDQDRPGLVRCCLYLAMTAAPLLGALIFRGSPGWLFGFLVVYAVFLWLAIGIAEADRLYGRPEGRP